MRRILILSFLATPAALGCSSNTGSSLPNTQPGIDAGADAAFESGEAPDDAGDADSTDALDIDAAGCTGFAVEAVCDDHDGCFAPAGCFLMGSPADEPGHDSLETRVPIVFDRDFWVMQYEVTNFNWTDEGLPPPAQGTQDVDACTDPDCPVTGITWFEALAFANLYSLHRSQPRCYQLDGCTGELGQGMVCQSVTAVLASDGYCHGYRVPTAAEWEYAARAGTTTAFFDGPIDPIADPSACADEQLLDGIAWYCHNSGSPRSIHPVGQKVSNPLRLYDMEGNAAEWVSDSYPSEPPKSESLSMMEAATSADGPGQTRGGGAASPPWQCRSAARTSVPKNARYSSIGFRLVQTHLTPYY